MAEFDFNGEPLETFPVNQGKVGVLLCIYSGARCNWFLGETSLLFHEKRHDAVSLLELIAEVIHRKIDSLSINLF